MLEYKVAVLVAWVGCGWMEGRRTIMLVSGESTKGYCVKKLVSKIGKKGYYPVMLVGCGCARGRHVDMLVNYKKAKG